MCYITFSLEDGVGHDQETKVRELLLSLEGVLDWGRLFPNTARPYYAGRYFVRALDKEAQVIESSLRELSFVLDISEAAQRELITPAR